MNDQAIAMFQQTVKLQDEYIWIKPLCDFFDISYKNSKRKILDDPILASLGTKKSCESLFGDKHPRVSLPKKGFIRWIQIINANTVREDLREQFLSYQSLIFDFLFGSVEHNQQTKSLYKRLTKLEHLKKKINSEIRSVKKRLKNRWNQRYLEPELPFKELTGNQ